MLASGPTSRKGDQGRKSEGHLKGLQTSIDPAELRWLRDEESLGLPSSRANSGLAGPASIGYSGKPQRQRSSPTHFASLLCGSQHECWVNPWSAASAPTPASTSDVLGNTSSTRQPIHAARHAIAAVQNSRVRNLHVFSTEPPSTNSAHVGT